MLAPTIEHCPAKITTADCGRLPDDRTDTLCTDEHPDEVGNTGNWRDDRLDRKEEFDLVHWEPDDGQVQQDEDEERDEVSGCGTAACGHAVW